MKVPMDSLFVQAESWQNKFMKILNILLRLLLFVVVVQLLYFVYWKSLNNRNTRKWIKFRVRTMGGTNLPTNVYDLNLTFNILIHMDGGELSNSMINASKQLESKNKTWWVCGNFPLVYYQYQNKEKKGILVRVCRHERIT